MTPTKNRAAQNLYRITSFDRAVEIITERKLYFAHPSTWDDPYEKVVKHEQSNAIFAQCWCRKALSDAMWRIYSPHSVGVRIGTTRQRLHQALTRAKTDENIQFKIQNVEYLYQEKLDEIIDRSINNLRNAYTFASAAESLFLKRKAFDHERETRVVICDPSRLNNGARKGVTIDVDPFEVITSIWIDPRAPGPVVDAYTYYLKDKLKFPGTVKKSGLYVISKHLIDETEAQ